MLHNLLLELAGDFSRSRAAQDERSLTGGGWVHPPRICIGDRFPLKGREKWSTLSKQRPYPTRQTPVEGDLSRVLGQSERMPDLLSLRRLVARTIERVLRSHEYKSRSGTFFARSGGCFFFHDREPRPQGSKYHSKRKTMTQAAPLQPTCTVV